MCVIYLGLPDLVPFFIGLFLSENVDGKREE